MEQIINEQKQKYGVSLADVREASKRIEGQAHITPVLTSSTLDERAGSQLYFKCELFQKIGYPTKTYTIEATIFSKTILR
jgi:hypothetical protein